MTDLVPITLEQQLKCVEREIEMRDRVYPRFVANGKMTQRKADQESATMRAVAKSLRAMMARHSEDSAQAERDRFDAQFPEF